MANANETLTIYELAQRLVTEAFPERNLGIVANNLDLGKRMEKVLVNTEKLEKLGWTPRVGVIDGFRRTVDSIEKSVNIIGD